MAFGVGVNVVLGFAFLTVGLFASILQYWLWTFPMVPDPTGVDPNGITTAPRFWRFTHRVLGYLFVAFYLILMVQMVPRIWQYSLEGWTFQSVAHAALGLMIGLFLTFKVLILRWYQQYGNWLLLVGSSILVCSIGSILLAAPPALKVLNHPGDETARRIILRNCTRCHGMGRVVGESEESGEWHEVLEKMEKFASKRGMPDPSAGQEERLAAFLSRLNPHGQVDEEWGEGDSGGRRRRGRDSDD